MNSAYSELLKSSIDSFWIGTAVTIAPDIEIDPITHEAIATPLDDALGRRFTRFGHAAKASHDGLIFCCEDGRVWQVKRLLPSGGRSGAYLAPKGVGNAVYTPPIPAAVLRLICDRHGLDYQETAAAVVCAGGFWPWVLTRPDIPIIVTEGAKKSLAALSQGYVAIALYGCSCGRSEDLQPYFADGRRVVVAFDADTKRKARRAVRRGIDILNRAACDGGAVVAIASWEPTQGKGVDDLITNEGAAAFDDAIAAAASYSLWQARAHCQHPLGLHRPAMVVNVPCLTAIAPQSIPSGGTVIIHAPMGTGKTKLIDSLLRAEDIGAIAPGHSIGLQRGLGARLGLDYIADCDAARGGYLMAGGVPTNRVSLCWDSLLKIPPAAFSPGSYDLILDEGDQGFRHLLRGLTCGKDGLRPGLMARAIALIKGARRVIVASATLTRMDIDLIAALRGDQPWILQNDYKRDRFPVELHSGGTRSEDLGAVLVQVQQAIATGKRVMIHSDQKATIKALARRCIDWGLTEDEVLTYHADNSSEDEQRNFAANPDQFLSESPKRVIMASPSLTSGVSIEGDYLDLVVGIFFGGTISPADVVQQLGRVRRPVQRVVWCSQRGRGKPETWAAAYAETEAKRAAMIQHFTPQSIPTLNDDDPIKTYLNETGARGNLEQCHFGAFLQARLESDRHPITTTTTTPPSSEGEYKLYLAARREIRRQEIEAIATAPIIDEHEAKALRDKRTMTYKDACKLERHDITAFYDLDADQNLVERDRRGKGRRKIRAMEALIWQDLAAQRDAAALDGMIRWHAPILSHDLPQNQLRSKGAIALGIPELITRIDEAGGYCSSTDWAIAFSDKAKAMRNDIRTLLGFTIHPDMNPCQVIGMVLDKVGIKTRSHRATDDEGRRYRVYRLDAAALDTLRGDLQRRAARHTAAGFQPRPHPLSEFLLGGVAREHDPPPEITQDYESVSTRGCVQAITPQKTPDKIPTASVH